MFYLENVFVTEGVPDLTFVKPPNYTALLVDLRRKGKPVIIEGQSGTGKTTTVTKAIAEIFPNDVPKFLTPREPSDLPIINAIDLDSGEKTFIIDDFHRLDAGSRERLANLAKVIAERNSQDGLPKLIIIGINNVGSDLIQLVPDIAKRVGIHRIAPGSASVIKKMIDLGSEALRISINNKDSVIEDSRGDYWLTQQICKTICISAGVDQTQETFLNIQWDPEDIKARVVESLHHNYDPPVRDFCRGRRFRPTNDPYYKLLRAVSEQERSNVDLTELANARQDIKGSINNVKDHRLGILLTQKETCARLFYYDVTTKNFAIEDPALFYYIKNLNWDDLRQRCGFRDDTKDFEWDVAISFAGQNRSLAEFISKQLGELDISTFYDRNYEDNYLGGIWSKEFSEVFGAKSRLVVAILDEHHRDKVWPTFERDCFTPRVSEGEVIPIFLDGTIFPKLPTDLVSIHFKIHGDVDAQAGAIIDDVVLRIASKLESL